jgi:hypothetical protein
LIKLRDNNALPEFLANTDLCWNLYHCNSSVAINSQHVQVLMRAPLYALGAVQSVQPFFSPGFLYFEVRIDRIEGGDVSVGVASHKYPFNLHIGWLQHSYGYHNDGDLWSEYSSKPYGPRFGQGDTIGCGLDFKNRKLYFTKNGKYLGTALKKVDLNTLFYPSVGLSGPGTAVHASFLPPFEYSNVRIHSPSGNNIYHSRTYRLTSFFSIKKR